MKMNRFSRSDNLKKLEFSNEKRTADVVVILILDELKIFAEIKIPLGVFHRYKFSRTCRTMFEINRIASVSVIKLQAAITTSKFHGKAKETVFPKQYFCT